MIKRGSKKRNAIFLIYLWNENVCSYQQHPPWWLSFCTFICTTHTAATTIIGIFPAKITGIVKQIYPIEKHPALQLIPTHQPRPVNASALKTAIGWCVGIYWRTKTRPESLKNCKTSNKTLFCMQRWQTTLVMLFSYAFSVSDVTCQPSHNCHVNSTCTNTNGSFFCSCFGGFSGNGTQCTDLDECTLAIATCSAKASCSNTIGSYVCSCRTGFSGNGRNCSDVNECSAAPCHSNATCQNTEGAFVCQCVTGFTGTGLVCSDVNECLDASACVLGAACTNTPGSYFCHCQAGYSGNGSVCEDIDECQLLQANASHGLNLTACGNSSTCQNTNGSYSCKCNVGYAGDGFTCQSMFTQNVVMLNHFLCSVQKHKKGADCVIYPVECHRTDLFVIERIASVADDGCVRPGWMI